MAIYTEVFSARFLTNLRERYFPDAILELQYCSRCASVQAPRIRLCTILQHKSIIYGYVVTSLRQPTKIALKNGLLEGWSFQGRWVVCKVYDRTEIC